MQAAAASASGGGGPIRSSSRNKLPIADYDKRHKSYRPHVFRQSARHQIKIFVQSP
jgi:hypothetical protein